MVAEEELGQMLTIREVARLLHVHSNTVRRWADRGIIRAYRISTRGDRRFKREDLARYLTKINAENQSNNKISSSKSYR